MQIIPAIYKMNHVAIAVPDLQEAILFWRDALGLTLDHVENVPNQSSNVAFFPLGEVEVELVEPTDTESGLAKFLKNHGPGLHHICFEVINIEATLSELQSKGIRLINETPIILDDRKIAFIHPKHAYGVLIELFQAL
jgi:methylmalonyl-CoA/ethylmalonyl-CoA epimerase